MSKPKLPECKKAWKAERHKINSKWYNVQVIRGCEKCPGLQSCGKMEAICERAGQKATGTVNKLIKKRSKP